MSQKIFYLFISGLLFCFSLRAQAPVAGFTVSPTSGCLAGSLPVFPVTCTSTSTGNPVPTLSWDFGDGTPPSSSSSHAYTKSGTFTITLTANNVNGSSQASMKVVVNPQPAIAFTGTPLSGCFPLNVQFTDNSTSASGITARNWDFGDGVISSATNPKHTYINASTPGPLLTVTDGNGCKASLQKPGYISIPNGVAADFNSDNSATSCSSPIQVNFTNNTTGGAPGITYNWNFGDGTSPDFTQNPVHNYTATGTFIVTMIATSTAGCTDTIQHPVVLSADGIVSDFIAPDSLCINNAATFMNASSPAPTSSNWDFGDGGTSINTNPTHTYSAPGDYIVKLTNVFGGTCTNVVSKKITVTPVPKADFKSDVVAGCQAPLTVNFSDLSANATHWQWDFGDGSPISIVQNPTHIYTKMGSYNVTLVVSNAAGCGDEITKSAYIQITQPIVNISNLPFYGCIPLSFVPVQNNTVPDGIASYSWDFGDGTTSTSAAPSHTYTAAGKYLVKLNIVSYGGCKAGFSDYVTAGANKPTAAFTVSPSPVCSGSIVQFTDHSSPNTNQWLYSFGDGTTSNQASPTHKYSLPGTYIVKLIAYDNGCNDSSFFTVTVSPPGANFNFVIDCTTKSQVSFTDKSTAALTWAWDFGDGSAVSNSQNPSHTYAPAASRYNVVLTVTNGACTAKTSIPVNVIYEKADFNAVPLSCKNTAVNFAAVNSNPANIQSYTWDFGDGQRQSGAGLATTSHIFSNFSAYTIKLIITDLNNCKDSISKSIQINGPKAIFTATNIAGCKNLSPVFTDQSTTDGINPITNWTWDFGDGTIQSFNGPPYTHVYPTQGIYSVKLKITDAGGCADSTVATNLITVSIPSAGFSSIDSACVGKPVKFTNNSTGKNLVYKWYFGDGGVSNLANPSHNYTAIGKYTVSLKVSDIYGCSDSIGKTNYMFIDIPTSSFTMSAASSSCPPLQIDFQSTGHYNSTYKWIFGDGNTSTLADPVHTYVLPGVFTPTLIVTSPGGCTDTFRNTVTVNGPNGVFKYTPLVGCNPLPVNYTLTGSGAIKYTWDFNDGTTLITNVPNTSHIYTATGIFSPQLILEDAAGCKVLKPGPQNIVVQGSVVNFLTNMDSLCESGSIHFTDATKSVGAVSTYNWNFGDGGTANTQNPDHFYANPGSYTVKSVVTTQAGCPDSVTKTNLVRVFAKPDISVTGANSGCTPDTLHLQAIIQTPDTIAYSWAWNFFNGTTSSLQNPPVQIYTKPQDDSLQLITTGIPGCSDTIIKLFTIYPLPTVNAGNDTTICLTQSAQLQASGAATYNWLPPNNSSLSCSICSNPVATPPSTTSYTLLGTSSVGCQAKDTITVTVLSPQTITVSPPDSVCIGQSVTLMASGNTEFLWTPAAGLSSNTSANPVATPDTTTIYQVVGTDNLHCFTDTQYVKITVFHYPTIVVDPHAVNLAVGSDYTINSTGSPDIVSINWTPTTGMTSCIDCLTPVTHPVKTITYTVKVVNDGGCAASDSINIVVSCPNSNVFIPNTFSPNGDGVNDYFFVQGKGLTRIQSMRIFNRWGQMVFEKRDFLANTQTAGWDGTFNGKPAALDVYVYTVEVVCENSAIVPVHGNVALIR